MELNFTVLIGIATFAWTVYQYLDGKKRDQDLKEFENYHRLIKELVQPEGKPANDVMYIDRQTAILYELRHFKRYYPFSYRTVIGLYEKWKNVPNQFPRLLEECQLTIEFLKGKGIH